MYIEELIDLYIKCLPKVHGHHIATYIYIVYTFLSPPVQFVEWAHMQHFLSVCLFNWTKKSFKKKKKIDH